MNVMENESAPGNSLELERKSARTIGHCGRLLDESITLSVVHGGLEDDAFTL